MAADDIRAQADTWVQDEVGRQCFGEDYGWALTWIPSPVQGPQGVVFIPMWQLVLTCRNPLVGQGDLNHIANLGAPRPKEADVRREVAEGIRQLRELAAQKISGSNGHAKQPVPG